MNDMILRLAARGDGVSAAGVHIAGAAPGDAIGSDGALIRGEHYQQPPCPHYGRCGGCQLQHVDDASYATYLSDRIISGLAAQGLDAPLMQPPALSPPRSRRRIALRALKQGKRLVLGYAEAGSHTLIDLRDCPVMHPALLALIAPLRALLPLLLRERRPAELRMTLADQGVDLMMSGVEAEGLAAAEAIIDFAGKHKLARLSLDEGYGPAARWEPQPVTICLGGVAVGLPDGAFLQATAEGEQALIGAVRAHLGGATRIADLFAGLGTFAFGLDGQVHAVEGARDAILALQVAANRSRPSVSSDHRDLYRRPLTAAELSRFDAVVLDPPRAGAKEQVIELAASAVPRIAYVSCNPATFARDARLLVDGGYRLDVIQPVGQFRWSTHAELAAGFSRV